MSKKDNVVFYDMTGRGRVIAEGDDFIAQTLIQGRSDRWRHASASQALGLIKKTLAVSRLKKGDTVVFWEGSRFVLGTYIEPLYGEHQIQIGSQTGLHYHVLPLKWAVKEGKWPFVNGLAVAALVDGSWQRAVWRNYEAGQHTVELADGSWEQSDRAHKLEDAIRMELVEATPADVLPQQRDSFDSDLSLLTASMMGQGRIRCVAQNGVMIRFSAHDREFEGLAPFQSMPAELASQVANNQLVSFRVVVVRHDNWKIPVLEITSIDSPKANG